MGDLESVLRDLPADVVDEHRRGFTYLAQKRAEAGDTALASFFAAVGTMLARENGSDELIAALRDLPPQKIDGALRVFTRQARRSAESGDADEAGLLRALANVLDDHLVRGRVETQGLERAIDPDSGSAGGLVEDFDAELARAQEELRQQGLDDERERDE